MVLSFSEMKVATSCRRVAFDDDEQVVAAAHQVAALHFGKVRDARREPVEAAAALRRDLHLDDRGDRAAVSALRREHRLVTDDHSLAFKAGNFVSNSAFAEIELAREIGHGGAGVATQKSNERVHQEVEK